MLYGLAYEVLV